jgi:hypothetical protein
MSVLLIYHHFHYEQVFVQAHATNQGHTKAILKLNMIKQDSIIHLQRQHFS